VSAPHTILVLLNGVRHMHSTDHRGSYLRPE
jgi:hypothetical protein